MSVYQNYISNWLSVYVQTFTNMPLSSHKNRAYQWIFDWLSFVCGRFFSMLKNVDDDDDDNDDMKSDVNIS